MKVERIYWDSDCFLAHFQQENGKSDLCDGTLERATNGQAIIVTSALTIAEVLWLKGGPRLAASKKKLLRKYFRRSIFRVTNVTREIAHTAQDIVWDHQLKPKDAIHVATALFEQADALETFDGDLIDLSSKIGKPPLVIRKPKSGSQTKLALK